MDPITILLLGIGGYFVYTKFIAPGTSKTPAGDEVPGGVKMDPNKKGTGFEDDPLSKACSGDVQLNESDVLYAPYMGAFTSDSDPESLEALAKLLDESCHATAAAALRQKASTIVAMGGSDKSYPCGVVTPLPEDNPLYEVYQAALITSTSATAINAAADLLEANCFAAEAKSLRDKLDVLKTFGAATAGRYSAMAARAAGR